MESEDHLPRMAVVVAEEEEDGGDVRNGGDVGNGIVVE